MTIGNRIYSDFPRPDSSVVEALRGIPVANIDDAINRLAAVDGAIRPFNGRPLLGPAFTVKVPEGDNLMFHKAMDLACPGDVIVIDAGGYPGRAIFGELMLSYCQTRGIAGVIVDGALRDAADMAAMTIPVYARGVSPNGPYKNGPGEINTEISFGGQIVRPGDIVIGDADGIVFLRPEEVEQVTAAARSIVEMETQIRDGIIQQASYPRPWVDQKLREIGCAVDGSATW